MSTVDNRIVRMQFDNAQFEAGVMKSMNTIDKLNEKLQFKEAGKGISALQVAIAGVDFSSISNGVEKMAHNFTSVTGMLAQRIKTDIVDSAINAAKKLESATLGQIKSGGWARANNIANAKFTIEGLKYSWDEVRKAADYAVTDTAYGLDQAAKAASQLAASGVDFQEIIGKDGAGNDVTQMHKSLRAISGVAAMTNSSYDEISHVFTRIAGQGKVMANDLNSIAARGINAAATLADHFGVTEAEIRDLVSKGEIDFQMFSEAMDDAFGDHAKEANKTFTGSLSNMKAALSRIGAIFAQPVVDKTNTFFIAVTSRIKEFQKALSDTTTQVVKGDVLDKIVKDATKAADKLGLVGKQKGDYIARITEEQTKLAIEAGKTEAKVTKGFQSHFAEAWEAGIEAASKFVEILNLDWFKSVASVMDELAIKATDFFKKISKGIDKFAEPMKKAKEIADGTTGAIKDNLELDLQDLDLLHRILKNEFGYTEKRWKALDDIYAKGDSGKTGRWLQGYMDQLAGVGYNFEKLGWTEEEFKKKQEEATKSEAKRLEEMSKEEVFIEALVVALDSYKNGMEAVRASVSNFIKTVSNLATTVGKVMLAIGNGLGQAGINFHAFAALVAPISEAFVELSEAMRPTESELFRIIDVFVEIGDHIYDVISSVAEVAYEFVSFAAAVIASRESLDDLAESDGLSSIEMSVIAVLKVLRNFWTIVKNIGKSVGRILVAIKNAFKKVFDPSGVLMGFSSFTDGLAGISEKLVITEKAALGIENAFTLVFTVIQSVATAISKVIGGIVKFIGGEKKATKATDALKKTADAGSKTTSIFQKLGEIIEKLFKKVEEFPDKFKRLMDAINQQEGVIRLKESFGKLWKSIKEGIANAAGPATDALGEFVEATGATGATGFGILVNGIGIVAGKIADFIDMLPTWGTNIKNFFNDTMDDIKAFADKLGIADFFKTLGNAVDVSFDENELTITGKVKKFFKDLGTSLYEQLSSVDWMKVGKESIIALIFANLFNVFKTTDELAALISAASAIPKNINKIFVNFNSLITVGKGLAKKLTMAYFIKSIAQSIIMIAGAVYILADMPQEQLKEGLAAVTWVAVIIMALGKAFEMLTRNLNAAGSIRDSSTHAGISIVNKVSGLFTTLLGLAAVFAAIYLLMKGFSDLASKLDTIKKDDTIGNTLLLIAGIVAGIGVYFMIMLAATRLLNFQKDDAAAFISIGIFFAGLGVALLLISEALKVLNNVDIKIETVAALAGILFALTLLIAAVGYAAQNTDYKSMLAMTAVIFVVTLALAAIGSGLLILTGVLIGIKAGDNLDAFKLAVGSIAILLLFLGLGVAAIVAGLKRVKYEAVLSVAVVIVAITAALGVIALSIGYLAKVLAGEGMKPGAAAAAIATVVGTLIVIGVLVMIMLKQLAPMREKSYERILAVAAVFAAIGVCALALGAAAQLATGADVGAMVFICLAIAAVAGIIVATVAMLKHISDPKAVEGLFAIAVVFVAIGAAMYILALSLKMLAELDMTQLGVAAGIMFVFMALFSVLAVFLGANTAMAAGFKAVASGILMIGVAFLAMGAGLYISAKAMELITNISTRLAESITLIATAIEGHTGVFIGIIVTCIAIAVVISLIVVSIMPLTTVVTSVIGSVVSMVTRGIGALSTSLSTAFTNFVTWWSGSSKQVKTMFVSMIVTLCAAIIKASPEVLKTIGKLIIKVADFLIELIPVIVDKLVDILLALINALADKIRQESARIAYAVWNVVEALLEVIMDVVVEGIGLFLSMFEGVPLVGDLVTDAREMLYGGAMQAKAAMRDGLAAANEYADAIEKCATTEELMAAGHDKSSAGWKSMKSDAHDAAVQVGLVEDAAKKDLGNNTVPDQISRKSDEAYRKMVILRDAATEASEKMGDIPQAAKDAYIKAQSEGYTSRLGAGYLKKEDAQKSAKEAGKAANNELMAQPWKQTGVQSGKDTGNGIIEGVTNTITDKADINGMTKSMFGGSDNPQEFLTQGGFGADDWGAAGTDTVGQYTEDGATAMKDENLFYDSETDNMKAANEAVKDARKEHVETVRDEIVNPAANELRKGHDRFYKAGEWAISGYTAAIRNGADEANKVLTQVAAGSYGEFIGPRGLDENSPSKKFYQAGVYATLGFINGIQKNEETVGATMNGLSSTVIDSFGNPMQYVASMANGDIQYDPSIRPVLDTSGIARGAYGIDSMFQNQNVTLSGLSGQIAADIGQLDSRNSDVVEELKALREEMSYLSDDIQQMQVVMDTGALVGTMAGPMDKAMGRRAIYRGRGN